MRECTTFLEMRQPFWVENRLDLEKGNIILRYTEKRVISLASYLLRVGATIVNASSHRHDEFGFCDILVLRGRHQGVLERVATCLV